MNFDPPPDDVAFWESDEEPWESAAQNAIHEAISGIAFDEVRGSIYLMSGENPRFNRVEDEFQDEESPKRRLTEIGENWWLNYVPFYKGKPVDPLMSKAA